MKIQRQLAVTKNAAREAVPSAAARPPIAVQARTALPRRFGAEKEARRRPSDVGRHQRGAGGLDDAKRDQALDAVWRRRRRPTPA